MALIGGKVASLILEHMRPFGESDGTPGSVAHKSPNSSDDSKYEQHLGKDVWKELAGKTVVDFGCGEGQGSIEIARKGAGKVIGLDIRDDILERGTRMAKEAGVSDRCIFTKGPLSEKADVILSVDAFEHFSDPAGILATMHKLVKDDGCVIMSFGPLWLHPRGGHLFSGFPWAHVIFSEESLIQWRSKYRKDGATKFSEVEGGLNQMTIKRFEQIVAQSDFKFAQFEPVPIRKLRHFINPLTREFFTSVVRCRLVPR